MSEVLKKLIEKYKEREKVGKGKYGVTMDRTDLEIKDWLIHLQEELMDASLYVTKIIEMFHVEQNNENEVQSNTQD